MRNYIRRFLNKRVAATLRRDLPVLPFLALFLAGQAAAVVIGGIGVLCAAIIAVLPVLVFRALSWKMILPFFAGAASVLICLPEVLPDIPNQISVSARVIGQVRRPHPGSVQFMAVIEETSPESRAFAGRRVLLKGKDLPWFNLSSIRDGAAGIFRIRCEKVEHTTNPFSYEATLLRHGVSLVCTIDYAAIARMPRSRISSAARDAARRIVMESCDDNEDTGLFLSMFLGIQDTLGDSTERAFKRTGLMHILVVSGYQVTLFYYFIYAASFFVLVRIRGIPLLFPARILAHSAGLVASLFYVFVTGAEAAVVRAGVAIVLLVSGIMMERSNGLFHTVLVTLLIISLISPGALFEPGTEFTFAALLGIALGARPNESAGMQYLKTCFYASMFTSLVSICWFGTFSPIAFLLNPLLAAPVSAVVCKGGLLALLLLGSGFGGGEFILHAILKALHLFRDMVLIAAELPGACFECSILWRILIGVLLAVLILYAAIEATGGQRLRVQERLTPQSES